jgi:hypothetical protein
MPDNHRFGDIDWPVESLEYGILHAKQAEENSRKRKRISEDADEERQAKRSRVSFNLHPDLFEANYFNT